jgi:hypothetical protein
MSALPERLRDITADDLARVAEGWKMAPVSAKK